MITLVSEEIWEFDLEAALKEISAQRREQALKFRHELGQRLCVLAYQLLKRGLREEYGITENPIFEYNEHGKPAIVGHPDIFFNLSHSTFLIIKTAGILKASVPVFITGRITDSFFIHKACKLFHRKLITDIAVYISITF